MTESMNRGMRWTWFAFLMTACSSQVSEQGGHAGSGNSTTLTGGAAQGTSGGGTVDMSTGSATTSSGIGTGSGGTSGAGGSAGRGAGGASAGRGGNGGAGGTAAGTAGTGGTGAGRGGGTTAGTGGTTAGTGGTGGTAAGTGGTGGTAAGTGGTAAGTAGTGGTHGAGGASSGDVEQLCVDTINMYRATLGLAPYARWSAQETCADGQSQSDSQSGTAHGAFGRCTESAQNECPGWPNPPSTAITGCLKAMWAEGPGADFNAHGHYINMSSTKYKQVACGFYTTAAGKIWAVQDFK